MPFGLYDPQGLLFQKIKEAQVYTVVLLAEDDECREKTGRDLLALYREEGLTVFPLPTPNYGIPSNGQLADVLKQAKGEEKGVRLLKSKPSRQSRRLTSRPHRSFCPSPRRR